MTQVSVVIPVYSERDSVVRLHEAVMGVLRSRGDATQETGKENR
jgi:hypothetical protein